MKSHKNFISAERLVKLFLAKEEKEDFKYVVELNSWIYFYNGKVWTIDNAFDELYITLENIIEENGAIDFWDNEKIIKRAISNLQKRTYLKVNLKDLDTNDNLLNCNNGILNLDTLELIPHGSVDCKKLLITKIASVNYDKNADCPKFKSMLNELFVAHENVKDSITYFQKILGLTISGYNDEQLMYFLQGNGCNGKTTLAEIIYAILGDYALNFHKKYLIKNGSKIEKSYNFSLHGARFVLIKNFDEKDKFEEATIKQLTGGDTMQFKLSGNNFDFKFKGKIFCIINDLPKCLNGSLALRRRIKSIPFFNNFENANLTFYNELIQEKEGILNWLIEGYRKVDKNKKIRVPKDLENMSNFIINEAIPRSTLVIDSYLKSDEMHVMNIEQALSFIYKLESIGKCKLQNKDYVPANLGKMLKKYSFDTYHFDAREKFYIGVKIDEEKFKKNFGINLEFKGFDDYDAKMYGTHIKEQIQFHEFVINEINKKIEQKEEAERENPTFDMYNLYFDENDLLVKNKAERNLKFLEAYYKKLKIENCNDERIYSYE